ncbi:c-type cytochrome domain-containing protein [Isosphaeraceae bacterium EP7]
MFARPLRTGIVALAALACLSVRANAADAKKKLGFEDVAQIFRQRCNTCHNADKQKGGLNLENFGGTMQGGGSGKVVEPGDFAASTLFSVITHAEEPFMPPNAPKIPDAEIDVIKAWIEAGAPETAGAVVAMKAKPKFEFKLDPSALGKPVGPPAMPENLSTEPVVVSARANAILALAGSPWAPLVAVSGHKQVLLYQADTSRLLATLPFPEGTVNVLKFSRNGALLLAGGGRGGQSGIAVAWDVKTGKRVFEIGKDKEYDVVLAADISADHGQVALGGPGKVLRVYSTADNSLQFEMKKHTDWLTAIEFSPDGVLLASGDRSNGLVVWESQTGREFYDLRGHATAITEVSWRLDSNVVASSSEDGTVKLWEMDNGTAIKSWAANGGGVASVRFAKDGRLVTSGRDRIAHLWDQNGGKLRDFEAQNDLGLKAVFNHDDTKIIAGDWSGEVRVWAAADGRRLANLVANPAPVAVRLDLARTSIPTATAAADAAAKELAALTQAAVDKQAATAPLQQAHDAAAQAVAAKKAELAAAEKAVVDQTAAETAATTALTAAQAGEATVVAAKTAAEAAVTATIASEKAAAEGLAATKVALTKALADKTAADAGLVEAVAAMNDSKSKAAAVAALAELSKKTGQAVGLIAAISSAGEVQIASQTALETAIAARDAAPAALAAATEKAGLAAKATADAKAVVDQATAAKAVQQKLVADLKAATAPLEAALAARKAELDPVVAAKAAADKALADRKPALDQAIARVALVNEEVEALTAEILRSEAAKGATASAAKAE